MTSLANENLFDNTLQTINNNYARVHGHTKNNQHARLSDFQILSQAQYFSAIICNSGH